MTILTAPATRMLLAAAILLLTGCGAQDSAYPVAPALPAETIPLPPVSEDTLIWHPGDWLYLGGSYRYEPGRFEPIGEHGRIWTRGHWAGRSGSYRWIEGAWS